MRIRFFIVAVSAVFILMLCGCKFSGLTEYLEDKPVNALNVTPTDAATQTTAEPVCKTTAEEPKTVIAYDFSGLKYTENSAFACYDLNADSYLFAKNASARIYPASLTKIVSVCVALKYLDPASVFIVGDEIKFVGSNSSLCFIQQGHAVTMYDILCGMLLASGNDAAYTLAVNVARAYSHMEMSDGEAVEYFVGMMNDFCKEAELTESCFVNPEGWDDDAQYTTVGDLVKAVKYALQFDCFREIISMPTYHAVFVSGQTVDWKNSNLMLDSGSPYFLAGASGVKTGTTPKAGKCLAALYADSDHELLVISMGNTTDDQRYYSVKEAIEKVLTQ